MMKHKSTLLLLVLLAASFFLVNCSDDPAAPEKTRRDLLIAHPWRFQQATEVATGKDVSSQVDVETLTFFDNGIAEAQAMDEKRTTEWKLTNNDSIVVLDNEPNTILTLTDSKFTLRATFDGSKETDVFFVK